MKNEKNVDTDQTTLNWEHDIICLTAKILQNLTGDSVEFYFYILFITFEFSLTKGGETKQQLEKGPVVAAKWITYQKIKWTQKQKAH